MTRYYAFTVIMRDKTRDTIYVLAIDEQTARRELDAFPVTTVVSVRTIETD